MNVMILHPDLKDPGGIANYYMKLQDKFTIPVKHFVLGKRPGESGVLSLFLRMIKDYRLFIEELNKTSYDVIHLNPSLSLKGFLREGVFHVIAKRRNIRTVVFWRGWLKPFEEKIDKYFLWLFKMLYGQSDAFIVLADEFRQVLVKWGCKQPIHQEVTVVDDKALVGFNLENTIAGRMQSDSVKVLFLARTVKEKGVYETVQAFAMLKPKYPQLKLIIAGIGDELPKVKSYVSDNNIPDVEFPGYVAHEKKFKLLREVHIFCYPTYYAEGMPNTIMESMAFGLPIITRPVGGVADFFKHGEHGFISDSKEPEVFAEFMEKLLQDQTLFKQVNETNHRFAEDNFLASNAAARLQNIYQTVLN
jgi:glycosyltransferase involved in cell wall biosynthesis